MLTKEKADPIQIKLGLVDQCDKCYAAVATVAASKKIDNKEYFLLFCGHHGRLYEPALIIQGFVIN